VVESRILYPLAFATADQVKSTCRELELSQVAPKLPGVPNEMDPAAALPLVDLLDHAADATPPTDNMDNATDTPAAILRHLRRPFQPESVFNSSALTSLSYLKGQTVRNPCGVHATDRLANTVGFSYLHAYGQDHRHGEGRTLAAIS
jgi:hypothetical protein